MFHAGHVVWYWHGCLFAQNTNVEYIHSSGLFGILENNISFSSLYKLQLHKIDCKKDLIYSNYASYIYIYM